MVEKFYKWYIDWYKTILNEVTIVISLPNELQPFKEENVIILDLFKGTSDLIDTSSYLKKLLKNIDEYGLTVYIDSTPIGSEKNSKEFYLWLYKNNDFELTPNEQFMKRLPKQIK